MNVQDVIREADKTVAILKDTQGIAREAIRQRDVMLDVLREIVKMDSEDYDDINIKWRGKFAKKAMQAMADCGFDA